VADILTRDLDNFKEKSNMKRRVYDALNVMVASTALKKRGKTIQSSKNLHNLR
jgi:hypothetical protein